MGRREAMSGQKGGHEWLGGVLHGQEGGHEWLGGGGSPAWAGGRP